MPDKTQPFSGTPAHWAKRNAEAAQKDRAFLKGLRAEQARNQGQWEAQQQPGLGLAQMGVSWLFVQIVAGAFLIAWIRRRKRGRAGDVRNTGRAGQRETYRRAESLLTPGEKEFYVVLREAVGPQAVIQCKVRLADVLLAPNNDRTAFRRVSQKHVDFLLCQRLTLRPLLAIELDDASHGRRDRQDRDRFVDAACEGANLPILHVPMQSRYDPVQLLAAVRLHLPVTPTPGIAQAKVTL